MLGGEENVRSQEEHAAGPFCPMLHGSLLCCWITDLCQLRVRNVPGIERNVMSQLAASWLCLTSSARRAQITSQVLGLLRKDAVSSREGRSLPRQSL